MVRKFERSDPLIATIDAVLGAPARPQSEQKRAPRSMAERRAADERAEELRRFARSFLPPEPQRPALRGFDEFCASDAINSMFARYERRLIELGRLVPVCGFFS